MIAARALAPLVRVGTGARARWIGLRPAGPGGLPIQRVYFANHSSHLDALVVWASLPRRARARARPVAAKDYWGEGVRRALSRTLRVVLIDRGAADGTAFAPMERALRAGDSLILFPEGTRNPTPERGPLAFRSGLFHVARAFPAVELVPVHLGNLGRILPKGELAPVPLIASITFGPPLALLPGEDKDAFLGRARDAVVGLEGA